MITNFDELTIHLNLKSHSLAQNLEKLSNWCENNISTDLQFEGSLEERFDAYKDLASNFLENIQPNIQANSLNIPSPALEGKTPLQFIVYFGFDIYLKKLQPSVELLNTKINGVTLLQLAATRGLFHTTKVLLALGANPKEKSLKGIPFLFYILMLPIMHDEQMMKNKAFIYTLLLPYAEDILEQRNESGDTVLHIIAIYGYVEQVVEMLSNIKTRELAFISNNACQYPVHSAILNNQHHALELLMHTVGIEQLTDAKGRNALHYAAQYGDTKMIKMCLKCGIDSVDERGFTPLILAASFNSSIVKQLLDEGAQINVTDNQHRVALHHAVESNNEPAVQALLAHDDIDVNVKDDHSLTPLDLVQQKTPQGARISLLLNNKGGCSGCDARKSVR